MATTAITTKKTIRAVLIDLSGTLHIGDQPIVGAREALQKLRASGRRIQFLTNTSTKSSTKLLAQLHAMGLDDMVREELVTSVLATAAYVKKHKLKPLCLMEDTSDMDLPKEEQGSMDATQPHQDGSSDAAEDQYDSVVVGLAPSHFHYERLNLAFRLLQQHPDNLIAIHRGNYYRPSADDLLLSLGPGAFVTALETASQCRPAKVMGKPSREFFASALWDDVNRDEVCMIGDDVVGDIVGACDAGIGNAILVQTGKYQAGDEEKLDVKTGGDDRETDTPFYFLVKPSIVEAIDYILAS